MIAVKFYCCLLIGILMLTVSTALAVIHDFHQIDPGDGVAPTEISIVRVLYDNDYLSIAADLRDRDPDKIRVTQMIQGRLFFSDDHFWVTFDSFNSKRNDCLFQDNDNGVRREALRENNAKFIEEWAAIWHAQSALNDTGWGTEIAIPFRSISFDPGRVNSRTFESASNRPRTSAANALRGNKDLTNPSPR